VFSRTGGTLRVLIVKSEQYRQLARVSSRQAVTRSACPGLSCAFDSNVTRAHVLDCGHSTLVDSRLVSGAREELERVFVFTGANLNCTVSQ
jgi:hypothetical protein